MSDAPTATTSDPLWDDWDTPPRVPGIPELHLAGFDGPMDLLLDLAERQRIDLGQISILDLIGQFVAAMERLERHVAMERRADWLVMAARLLLLRSRLLFPASSEAETAAAQQGGLEAQRLDQMLFVRAAAAWLDRRPQLGRDVFSTPRRERDPRVASYMWLMEGCLAVLKHEVERAQLAAEEVYRPVTPALFSISGALVRMRRRLADLTQPMLLPGFLPKLPEGVQDFDLVTRSAVSSTFVAALELARNGELLLGEGERFEFVAASTDRHAQ